MNNIDNLDYMNGADDLLSEDSALLGLVMRGMEDYSDAHPMQVLDVPARLVTEDEYFLEALKTDATLEDLQQTFFDKEKDLEDYVTENDFAFSVYWRDVFVQVCGNIPDCVGLGIPDFELLEEATNRHEVYPTLDVSAAMEAALKQVKMDIPLWRVWKLTKTDGVMPPTVAGLLAKGT